MSFGFRVPSSGFFAVAAILIFGSISSFAQSSDQNFPTPLTTNEVDGAIKARDMGDPRATTYFYAFDGAQGDIFINAVTKNFSGDIDVFLIDTMTPLAKMVIYASDGSSETGRLIYLRKPERLIMRVEGRTPNDDPATFRIKFGGSFIALAPQKQEEAPTVAKNDPNEPGIKVDTIGRIVAVVPKPQPTPKVVEPPPVKEKPVAKPEPPATEGRNASVNERAGATKTTTAKAVKPPATKPVPKKKPANTGTVYENETAKVTVAPEPKANSKPSAVSGQPPAAAKTTAKTRGKPRDAAQTNPKTEDPKPETRNPKLETPADALASIRLVIQMKDGTVFWLPMNKVAKFTVDKGVMTVTSKDGSVTRYNILDVEKTTIQ